MKKLLFLLLIIVPLFAYTQDVNVLLKEADNLEKQLKEPEALDKYQQVAVLDTSNIKALVKCAELNTRIGARLTDKNARKPYYDKAASFANKAFAAGSNNADAFYVKALAADKMREIEEDKKKMVEDVRQIYVNATKALALNPAHAKANYILGNWHYEMLSLNWFKKAGFKTLYGGGNLPIADIDTAITYMEKCKTLEPYFVLNYLDLAKAYQFKNRPAQSIEVLNKLVHLPNRTADDAALKEEGKKLLEQIQ